jgi:hypothetical protein
MPDESPGVKTLWLTFGSATICGKEVDNFQPKNSDSAQLADSARGFFKAVGHRSRSEALTMIAEGPK